MSSSNAQSIYNKFTTESIDVVIKKSIIDTVLLAVDISTNYLKRELSNISNLNLKYDIERMDKVSEELIKLNEKWDNEVNLNITVAEFLIFKYGIETVEELLLHFKISSEIMEQYKEFIETLNRKYNCLDKKKVEEYYNFIASFDDPKQN